MSETNKQAIFYVGEYKKPLDDKRRLTVPSKWRFSGDDSESAYLALPNPNGSISVYPPQMLEKLNEAVSKVGMANPAKQKAIMRIFSKGDRFGCDKQGRIVLTEKLMQHAGIEREALAAGTFNHFQIWSPDRYDAFMAADGDEDDTSILEELGI